MYESDFAHLTGKRVASVFRNEAKDHIRFIIDDGSEVHYSAEGDCCSTSWIEHISGVCFLVGALVLAIEPGAEVPSTSDDEHECLQYYNYNIKTDKGTCAIEMRNSSNGYYGGSIERRENCQCAVGIAVADDF